ncbi:BRCA1-associated protein isoform X2 [Selaginella moellendorffii]|nr:BRCA1-associated protein isoform X2 [Selaginella moellendorffii]|eukprot:XP_002964385.2 BRCA1-associated protein isoform X2 [Selaginella moellendorffii]
MFSLRVFLEGEEKPRCDGEEEIEQRVAIFRGAVHLFRDVFERPGISFGSLPDERSENLCVLGVPSAIEPAEFFQIASSFSDKIEKLQCIRNDTSQIMVLQFDSQSSADAFYHCFDVDLLPLKNAICHVLYTRDVYFTNSLQDACEAPPGLTEIPTCTFCLQRLDEHISGVPARKVDSFDPRNSSCLVCWYSLQSENTTCSVCPTSENLWVCVICGFVGCGRYKEGHAIRHWKETRHCCSLELESQRVWDYVGDNYVHRFILSKTDGNLMELMAPSSDECSGCECSGGSDAFERSCDTKLDSLKKEYEILQAKQLESQSKYYEGRLVQIVEEQEHEIASAIERQASARLHKLQLRLDKAEKEKNFLTQLNQCLADNQKKWENKCHDLEERGSATLKLKDQRIAELEEQMQSLIKQLE